MKKKLIFKSIIFLFILIFFISIFFYKEILNFLIYLDVSDTNFLLIYLVCCFLYFLTPLPTTLIVILNGFLFKNFGLVLSVIYILFGSLLLFKFANQINQYLNINIEKFLIKKKIKISKLTKNYLSIFGSRYILPYFFHNIYYGLLNIQIKKFILIIFCAELPMIYILNLIGSSLKNLTLNYEVSYSDIFFNKDFHLLFLIMFAILVVINYLKKTFKNKKE